ncbi:MAG TPA: hypothetical protein DDW42_03695 [Desulfobacteraceae bacterium]|nr:hypothetical protein [Desulfobacteraceae bacterium]
MIKKEGYFFSPPFCYLCKQKIWVQRTRLWAAPGRGLLLSVYFFKHKSNIPFLCASVPLPLCALYH